MKTHKPHHHHFNVDRSASEHKTKIAVVITLIMMSAEILCGLTFNSMALFSDGWHMGTHAFALAISVFAYAFARKNAHDRSYSFGTWKVEIL
ncbi:MAG: cation transporter, partial [Spirochaetota bacterium]